MKGVQMIILVVDEKFVSKGKPKSALWGNKETFTVKANCLKNLTTWTFGPKRFAFKGLLAWWHLLPAYWRSHALGPEAGYSKKDENFK